MKHMNSMAMFAAALLMLAACAPQSTPSMMNTSRPQLVDGTVLQQVPVKNASEGYLYKLAEGYDRYGNGPLQLSLAYDPASRDYTAMRAFNDLSRIKGELQKFGVRSIKAETVKAEGGSPTLMISYDSVSAAAPAGCRNMPGFDDGLTTREIGDYRFGCSIDAMVAQQIYRPSDLNGNAASDPIDGRRAANNIEYYHRVDREEAEAPLARIGRSDIQQQ